ncbi:SWIM zinc finger family protein [Streptomyces antarcticus]|uniref:SWIM zinc finger family protein n=1 Tax=Streptomyces antarcticus TaxID=2996458 RepID=UPI002271F4A9|nr:MULTISPECIES: SWIM zinc finger family protein [unclassified Streptomyces]MCY0941430.1 SWIM zinc finger family protein [Streptomyces sp. H34-AA3]MCZ4085056.1 SWIM zinc finger family protein [Streptomyces sp. H34-S5]
MTHTLGLAEEDLRRLAGARSFERGVGYLSAVSRLEIGDQAITATVDGTDAYEVELTEDADGGLTGWCDCPYGQEGNFCKHCVAVGLTVLGQAELVPRQRSAAASRTRLLETWLDTRTREELLNLVREQLADDRHLRRRLELRAATAGEDTRIARERILSLLDTRPFARYGYVEYADAHAFGQQAAEAVTALRALTAGGRAADAVEVAREALRALGRTYGEIDDSDGLIGEVATGLAEAHLEACGAARPDPVETADWLVRHLLDELNDATDMDLFDYREVLGEPGLARARELAVAAWRANPKGWAEKFLMEGLLKADGGSVDALVAVHAADLAPNGHTHLVIAKELEAARRVAEALEWAERGLREAESERGPDDELVAFVCERYARAGRLADVVAIRRNLLRDRPSLAAYRQLRTTARVADAWEDTERAGALEVLEAAARPQKGRWYGGSVLVDALMDDADLDAAWQAAADGYADQRQWLALADRIRDRRPADALTIYLRWIEPLRERTGDSTYERMAELLLSARACHRTLGTESEFAAYLAALRTDQKRKRKLMATLDRHGL